MIERWDDPTEVWADLIDLHFRARSAREVSRYGACFERYCELSGESFEQVGDKLIALTVLAEAQAAIMEQVGAE